MVVISYSKWTALMQRRTKGAVINITGRTRLLIVLKTADVRLLLISNRINFFLLFLHLL
jgi:hypothetical protein